MDECLFPLPDKPIAQGEHILVVDDTPAMANLIACYLREAGYKVEIAHSAEEAWESLLRKLPILITVDDFLPGADGWKLHFCVEELYESDLPVLLIVDKAPEDRIFYGYYDRSLMCLAKPFNPKELLAFVRRILQTSSELYERYRI